MTSKKLWVWLFYALFLGVVALQFAGVTSWVPIAVVAFAAAWAIWREADGTCRDLFWLAAQGTCGVMVLSEMWWVALVALLLFGLGSLPVEQLEKRPSRVASAAIALLPPLAAAYAVALQWGG